MTRGDGSAWSCEGRVKGKKAVFVAAGELSAAGGRKWEWEGEVGRGRQGTLDDPSLLEGKLQGEQVVFVAAGEGCLLKWNGGGRGPGASRGAVCISHWSLQR